MYRNKKIVHILYLCVDILIILFCFYVPYLFIQIFKYNYALWQQEGFRFFLQNPNSIYLRQYSQLFMVWGIVCLFLLSSYRLHVTDRSLTATEESWLTFKAVFFSTLFAGVWIVLSKFVWVSRPVLSVSAILLFLSLSVWRVTKRMYIRRMIARGYNNLHILIVGAGNLGQALLTNIRQNPYLGLDVVGFLDDEKKGEVEGVKILGRTGDIENVIRKHFVDEVYIAIPSHREMVSRLLLDIKKLGRSCRVVADNFDMHFPHTEVRNIGLVTLLEYHEKGIHGTELLLKRTFDLAVSTVLLILFLPLFIFIAIRIKLDNTGPVFYVSRRVGKKGREFYFYKFRSMIVGAEQMKEQLREKSEATGPIFKIKDDPRVTRVGKWLRKYSLDELPQLINVWKGDISLVGPRPPTPDEVKKYDYWQMRRLEIRPGVICLREVRGRSKLSFYKWVKLDLWYIDNWSFWLDLKILWWTIPAIIKSKGAY